MCTCTYTTTLTLTKSDTKVTQTIILTDSVTASEQECGIGCPDQHVLLLTQQLQRFLWVHCSDHAQLRGNELEDRLASRMNMNKMALSSVG